MVQDRDIARAFLAVSPRLAHGPFGLQGCPKLVAGSFGLESGVLQVVDVFDDRTPVERP